jgi:hypothetical protein
MVRHRNRYISSLTVWIHPSPFVEDTPAAKAYAKGLALCVADALLYEDEGRRRPPRLPQFVPVILSREQRTSQWKDVHPGQG